MFVVVVVGGASSSAVRLRWTPDAWAAVGGA